MSLLVNIEKKLGNFHLRVDFCTQGGLLSLLGPSGSGKSLTLRCIAGLLRPDRGRIVLNGRVLYDSAAGIDLPPQKRRVGYLFQSYALIPHLTVLENVELGCHAAPRRGRRALRRGKGRHHVPDPVEAAQLYQLQRAGQGGVPLPLAHRLGAHRVARRRQPLRHLGLIESRRLPRRRQTASKALFHGWCPPFPSVYNI